MQSPRTGWFLDKSISNTWCKLYRCRCSDWCKDCLPFYDSAVIDIARQLQPSSRGELEIVDIHQAYLEAGNMSVERLGRGIAWLDTGTHESLLQAGQFVQTIEQRQNQKIACLEEISLNNKWINKKNIGSAIKFYGKCSYSQYLSTLIKKSLK